MGVFKTNLVIFAFPSSGSWAGFAEPRPAQPREFNFRCNCYIYGFSTGSTGVLMESSGRRTGARVTHRTTPLRRCTALILIRNPQEVGIYWSNIRPMLWVFIWGCLLRAGKYAINLARFLGRNSTGMLCGNFLTNGIFTKLRIGLDEKNSGQKIFRNIFANF